VTLAARLLLGIGVEPTPSLVAEIVRETSAIPFYIQAVVDQLQYRRDLDVSAVVSECITSNLWHTDHYLTRLPQHYGPEAYAALDFVAVSDAPVQADAIGARIAADDPDLALSRDDLLVLLDKLEKDHYLVREGTAERMSSPLLARIWRHHRRLP
jgi:hypothetical protein